MPKSNQRTAEGFTPQPSGACRKDSIGYISNALQRKSISAGRAVGLFDKAEQLSRLMGARISVIVQPAPGDMPILLFSTNDDLPSNMAELVQFFGPRLDAGGARLVTDLPPEKRLSAYLKRATDPALVIPHGCIPMVSSTPRSVIVDEFPTIQSGFVNDAQILPLVEEDFFVNSGEKPDTEDRMASIEMLNIEIPSPQFDANNWRAPGLDRDLVFVPKKLGFTTPA